MKINTIIGIVAAIGAMGSLSVLAYTEMTTTNQSEYVRHKTLDSKERYTNIEPELVEVVSAIEKTFIEVHEGDVGITLTIDRASGEEIEKWLEDDALKGIEMYLGGIDLEGAILEMMAQEQTEEERQEYRTSYEKIYIPENVKLRVSKINDYNEQQAREEWGDLEKFPGPIDVEIDIPRLMIKPSIYKEIDTQINGAGYYLERLNHKEGISEIEYRDLVDGDVTTKINEEKVPKVTTHVELYEEKEEIVGVTLFIEGETVAGKGLTLLPHQEEMIQRVLGYMGLEGFYGELEEKIANPENEVVRGEVIAVNGYKATYNHYSEEAYQGEARGVDYSYIRIDLHKQLNE